MSVISREQWKNHFINLGKYNKETLNGRYSIGVVNQSGSGSVFEQSSSTSQNLDAPTIPVLSPEKAKQRRRVRTIKIKTGIRKKKTAKPKSRQIKRKTKAKSTQSKKRQQGVKKKVKKKKSASKSTKNKSKTRKTLY